MILMPRIKTMEVALIASEHKDRKRKLQRVERDEQDARTRLISISIQKAKSKGW